MKSIVIVIVSLILASPVFGQTMSRDLQMDLDGDIDYTYITGSNAAESVIEAKGDGQLQLDTSMSADDETFTTNIQAKGKNIYLIEGVKTYTDDIYVTKLTGDFMTEKNYDVEIDTFPMINIKAEDDLTLGSLQRRIDFSENGLSLFEKLYFIGSGWVLDKINVSVEDEE